MADLTQTPANVAIGSSVSRVRVVQVAEAVVQGEPGYLDVTGGKYRKTDADASEEAARAAGIFLSPAPIDGFAVLAESGSVVNLGATLTVGETYVVSAAAGKIAPIGDVASGWYVTILGVASSTSLLTLRINATGVEAP